MYKLIHVHEDNKNNFKKLLNGTYGKYRAQKYKHHLEFEQTTYLNYVALKKA